MKTMWMCSVAFMLASVGMGAPANAQFPTMIPAPATLPEEGGSVTVDIRLPYDGFVMLEEHEIPSPRFFGVERAGERVDMTRFVRLISSRRENRWRIMFDLDTPGTHMLILEPTAQFESDVEKMATYYTKAFTQIGGAGEWQHPAGLPFEIVPLDNPVAHAVAHPFEARLILDGAPVSEAVRIGRAVDEPESYETDAASAQEVKANEDGIFRFTPDRPGWWRLVAVVVTDDLMDSPDGDPVPLKYGAVLWLHVAGAME